jgi:hypothetical protein
MIVISELALEEERIPKVERCGGAKKNWLGKVERVGFEQYSSLFNRCTFRLRDLLWKAADEL